MDIFAKYRPLFSPEGEAGSSSVTLDSGTVVTSSSTVGEDISPIEGASDDFSGFDEPDLDIDLTSFGVDDGSPAAAPAPVAAQPTPVAPAAPASPLAPAATPATPPAPTAPTAPAAPAATAEPAASTPSAPQDLAAALTQHRGAIIDALAAERFAMTPEETAAFDLDAAAAAPKLMARVYYETVNTVLAHFKQFEQRLPSILDGHSKIANAAKEAETAFFGKFPGISREKHWNDIVAFSNAYQSANPNLSTEDLHALVGAAVMAKHGIAVTPARPSAPPPGATPYTPPFVPAAPGARVQATPEDDPWAGMDHPE